MTRKIPPMVHLKPNKPTAKSIAIKSLAARYIELLRLRGQVEELEAKGARLRPIGAARPITFQPDLPD